MEVFVELKAARCLSSCQFLFGRNLVYENKLSKLAKLVLYTDQGLHQGNIKYVLVGIIQIGENNEQTFYFRIIISSRRKDILVCVGPFTTFNSTFRL